MNRGEVKSVKRRAIAKRHVARKRRSQTITQARLKRDARLPGSKISRQWRLRVLNRIKRNLFIRRRDRSRGVWCFTNRHLAYLPTPYAERTKRSLAAIETRRNSIFVACRQVAGEVSKITLLSGCHPAVSERNESRRSLLRRDRRCNGEIPRHGNWQVHRVRRNTSAEASYSSPEE